MSMYVLGGITTFELEDRRNSAPSPVIGQAGQIDGDNNPEEDTDIYITQVLSGRDSRKKRSIWREILSCIVEIE